jgi:serine/threonine protein kinase
LTPFEPISFGRYFLVDKIAVGGMAEVFKAKSFSHGGFEKLLVIKRILQHLTENEDFVHMFIDEAKISVELQHPNIVQIYDFGRIAENYFIAMECVEGKDVKGILRKLAERRKLLPMEYAVYIAHEMCKGLDYAHKRTDMQGSPLGIVHRDVSPSNILVSYSGEIKVADFGIAKAQISAFNTKGGILKGKFEYMSPEQASGEDLSHQSDLFSAGIILHEMLTGRRLFKTDSDIKTLEQIKAVDVKPPSSLNPGIPTRLDDIVMRALTADQSARFQNAREFQNALLEFMYPATPDLTRENLGHFMTELFSAEIRTEREQLEVGTKAAADLHEYAPEIDLDLEWEESPGSGQTIHVSPSRTPPLIALLAFLCLTGIVIWATSQQRPQEPTLVVQPQPALPASLHLKISPSVESTVTVNGKVVSTGSDVLHADLVPDKPFELRVTAPGYLPYSDRYTVAAGERLRVPVRLTPIPIARQQPKIETTTDTPATPATPATPDAPEPAAPGMLSVNVRGGWAEVSVDGRSVDTTPLYQHPLPAGRHTVEIVDGASGARQTRVVTIIPNQTTRVNF